MEDLIVTEDMLAGLPAPVQRYMEFTGVLGRPWIENVALAYQGKFRLAADRPWMPMTARQTFAVSPPAFVWDARFKVLGLSLLRARDEYSAGRGRMFGRLAGLITLFDVRGEKLDQGARVRFLSEMIWFPIAYLGPNITWQAVDDHSAEVQLDDSVGTVSGRMSFGDDGRPTGFTAMRYREVAGDFSFDSWTVKLTGHAMRAGLRIPTLCQVVWNLAAGDLEYLDLEVTEVAYT